VTASLADVWSLALTLARDAGGWQRCGKSWSEYRGGPAVRCRPQPAESRGRLSADGRDCGARRPPASFAVAATARFYPANIPVNSPWNN